MSSDRGDNHVASLARGLDGELRWSLGESPVGPSTGLGTLVPGLLQRRWGQGQRLGVLRLVCVRARDRILELGDKPGLGLPALAFFTHVSSVTDVLRQWSFPVYPAKRSLVLVSLSLGLILYLPVITALSILAWPGFEPASTGVGFLVDRHAYREKGPSQGQWVWVHPSASEEAKAARVVAVSGEEVEWTGHNWKVDGKDCDLLATGRFKSWPQACRFKIPPNHILVEPRDDGVSDLAIGPVVLVPPERIIGRAWVQYYPVWDRRLL